MGPYLRGGQKQATALKGVRSQPVVPLGVSGGWEGWDRLASRELLLAVPSPPQGGCVRRSNAPPGPELGWPALSWGWGRGRVFFPKIQVLPRPGEVGVELLCDAFHHK